MNRHKGRVLGGLSLAVLMVSSLPGCATWAEQDRQAAAIERRAMLQRMAGQPLVLPHGREMPPLQEALKPLYHEVVALLHTGRGDPGVFDTSAAQPCELSEDTRTLMAYQMTALEYVIRQRRDALSNQMTLTPAESLEVSLLAGDCRSKTVDGPFDAVTRMNLTQALPTGAVQTVVVRQRVRGTLRNGVLEGALNSVRQIDSTVAGHGQTVNWSSAITRYSGGREEGAALTYGEHSGFNSLRVESDRPNGMRTVTTFTGSQPSMSHDEYRGQIYGPLMLYVDGRPSSSTCFWGNTEVADRFCLLYTTFPPAEAFETSIGTGLMFPRDARGAFQVRDVFYPGPAAQAGLLPGDIVTHVDGQLLSDPHDVAALGALLAGAAGTSVTLRIVRGGEAPQDLTVVRGPFTSVAIPNAPGS